MIRTLKEAADRNRAIGHHWFDADTMRFFKTRIVSFYPRTWGACMVTSEKGPDMVRAYSVRRVLDTGEVDTVGPFQGYATAKAAQKAAQAYVHATFVHGLIEG